MAPRWQPLMLDQHKRTLVHAIATRLFGRASVCDAPMSVCNWQVRVWDGRACICDGSASSTTTSKINRSFENEIKMKVNKIDTALKVILILIPWLSLFASMAIQYQNATKTIGTAGMHKPRSAEPEH